MSIKRRLSGLEKAASETAESEPLWSPPEVYARLHRGAQAEIGQALEGGEEPLFWIDDAGSIRAVDDDSLVRHLGDYVRAGDRKMRRLEREIAEDRASMTLEEIQQANAEDKELRAALSKLSLDEAIAFLGAEIAQTNAQIAEEEAEGEGGAYLMSLCAGIKRNGESCTATVEPPQTYCWWHDPANAEQRRRAASNGGKSKPNRDVADIKRRLLDLADGVLDGSVDKGVGAVGSQILNVYLRAVSVELKVLETRELEARIEELSEAFERQQGVRRHGT